MSHARRARSAPSTKLASRRRGSYRSRRLYDAERLELRSLMAGDVASPFHNSWYAQDVNNDYQVTPLDALLIINEINTTGPRALTVAAGQGGQGEEGGASFIDVNGDGYLTPLDALEVINHLNAQGEAPFIASLRTVLYDESGEVIDPVGFTADNKPIYNVNKGDAYSVSVQVRDNRPVTIPGDTNNNFQTEALGVYAAFGDYVFDTAFSQMAFQEQQGLTISGIVVGSNQNVTARMTLTIPDFDGTGPKTTAPIDLFGATSLRGQNEFGITQALNAILGSGAVTVKGPTGSSNNGQYVIQFTNRMSGIDVGKIQASIVAVTPPNSQTPTVTVNEIFSPPAVIDAAYLANKANILDFLNYGAYSALGGSTNAFLDLAGTLAAIQRIGGQANGDITTANVDGDGTDYGPDDGDLGYIEMVHPYFRATTATAGTGTLVSFLPSGQADDGQADGTGTDTTTTFNTLLVGNTLAFKPTVPKDRIEYLTDFVLVVKGDITAVADTATAVENGPAVSIDASFNDSNNVAGVTTKLITGFGANGNSTADVVTAEGTLHLNTATNRIEFTPSANFFGTYTFQYGVTDSVGGAVKDVGTVTLTVQETNDNPLANADNFSSIPALVTPEDTSLAIALSTLLANDTVGPDPTANIPGVTVNGFDTLAITPSVDGSGNVQATGGWVLPQHGTLKFAGSTLTYQPTGNYNGTDTFTYTLSDGRGGTATAVVTLNVTAVNDAPTANPDTGNVPDNVPTVFSVLTNDSDVENSPLTLQSFTIQGGTRPQVQVSQVGNALSVTSDVGYFGAGAPPMTINYVVSDGLTTSTSTLTLTFIPSRFPLAVDDTIAGKVTEDVATATDITADLIGNDRGQGVANAGLKITGISLTDRPAGDAGWTTTGNLTAADGTVITIDASGNVTFKPGSNLFGNYTFFYRLDDTINTTPPDYEGPDVGMAVVVITPDNDAPTLDSLTGTTTSIETNGTTVRTVTTFATASPGPLETGLFNGVPYDSVTYVVTATDNSLFTASGRPAISANGTLTYTPAADANGTTQVSVQARDSFGVLSAPQTFTLTITPVNNAPVFTPGANQTVQEDAAGTGAHTVANWITGIGPGAANEAGEVLTFEILSNDNPGLFSSLPAITINGGDPTTATLAYTSAANANGTATITYRLNGAGGANIGNPNSSAVQTLVINVTAVNDAPVFTKGADETVLEDAAGTGVHSVPGWATGINAGAANESAEVLTFALTNDNNGLFSVQPTLTISGTTATLNYTTAANANGTATVTVRLNGAGGVGIGAANFTEQTFVINVTPVNDLPTFTPGANQTVLEDLAGTTGNPPVANFITNINPGAANESAETLNFVIVTNTNAALFASGPTITRNGTNATLNYTLNPNANGTAIITYRLDGVGGTGIGAANSSADQTFTINVTAVNDKPAFTLANSTGSPLDVNEDGAVQAGGLGNAGSPSYSIDNFVTNFAPGPATATDEAGQTFDFAGRIIVGNPALFTAAGQPKIDTAGKLTFTLADNANGSTSIRVRAQDSGGTANNGVNLSDEVEFTLNVKAVNDPPTANDDSGAALRIFKFLTVSGPINLVANDSSAPDGNENLTIVPASLTNFVATANPNSPAGAAATLSFTLSADGKSVILNNPNGFFGSIALTYTVQDPGGLTDTAVATFEIVDFIPGTISGVIWGDSNGDGRVTPAVDPYHAERKIGGIEVYLTGNSNFNTGDPNLEDLDPNTAGIQRVLKTRSDALGQYSFANVSPGTYSISLDNPATGAIETPEYFVDALDIIREPGATAALDKVTSPAIGSVYQVVDPADATHKTAVTHTAANTFKVVFDERGTDLHLDFAVNLAPGAINIRDNVSNSTFDGALFGLNKNLDGDEQQFWFSNYENWNGTRCLVSMDGYDVNLSWDDGTNTHFVKLNLVTNSNIVRVHMSAANGDTVLRIVGSLSSLLSSIPAANHTVRANSTLPTTDDAYATAVDGVFDSWN